KSSHQSFAGDGRESLQPSRHALSARSVSIAKTTSRVSGGRVGLFLPKRATALDRRGCRERAAIRAPGPRPAKSLALPGSAREPGNDPDYLSRRHKID